MAGAPANLSFMRFSTDELPERERLPTFQDVFGRAIAKADVEPVAGTHLRIEATVRAMPGLGVWIGAFSPLHGRRTRELIADGNDNVTLWMCPESGSVISQCGREVTHHGDDAMLLSNSDMLSTTTVRRSHQVSLSLPRKVMLTMVPDLEDAFVRSVPKDSEPLRLLKSYVGVLEEDVGLATPELRHLVVSHVYDLAAFALGASGDVARVAESHGVRAARLRAIKTDVLQALGDHDLTVTAIAARHHVTPALRADAVRERGHYILPIPALAEASGCAWHVVRSALRGQNGERNRLGSRLRRSLAFQSRFPPPLRRVSLGCAWGYPAPQCVLKRVRDGREFMASSNARETRAGRPDRRAVWSAQLAADKPADVSLSLLSASRRRAPTILSLPSSNESVAVRRASRVAQRLTARPLR